MKGQYAIIDKNGIIFQGDYNYIQEQWGRIYYEDNPDNIKWNGDIMLVGIMFVDIMRICK